VVGGHDDQRLIVQSHRAQPRDQPAYEPIGVAQLQHVALLSLRRQPAIADPPVAEDARHVDTGHGIDLPVREIFPGGVRELDVREVELRPLRRRCYPAQEALESSGAIVGGGDRRVEEGGWHVAVGSAKAGERAVDRRKALA
jgi:hypothetical protein